jgi:6-pyruvoyltetrahydropterin/6-carboxytetrahydropterin synthase
MDSVPSALGVPRTHGADGPVLVPVSVPDGGAARALQAAAEASRCRLYAPVGPHPVAAGAAPGAPGGGAGLILEGPPEGLHELRNRLLALPAFDRIREAIERTLGERAAPGGLPRLDEARMKTTEVAEEMAVERGTTLLVSKDFFFDAAHNLPRYAGKCEHLHGHTFRLRVTLKAPLDTWSGMAFDFMDLKRIVDERIVKILDHAYINEIIANPSAEFISVWVWRKLGDLPLHEVKVWETPTSFVSYSGPPKR